MIIDNVHCDNNCETCSVEQNEDCWGVDVGAGFYDSVLETIDPIFEDEEDAEVYDEFEED